MTNEITYYPTAKWASISGAFTADDLREIADKIENPKTQSEPIKSEERSQKAIEDTINKAKKRQEERQSKD